MAINIKLPEFKKSNKIPKGKMPTKNYINVLAVKKQSFDVRKRLPVIILIALLLILAGKFFVIDRLADTMREANRLETLQSELIAANAQIDSLQGVEESYAHYTTSGMTEEELSRVDRVAAMKLIEGSFLRGNISRSWNLTGNVMTLQVNGPSLSELNQLASEMEANPIVEQCVISTANKHINEADTEAGNVAVTFIIYLQPVGQDENVGE